MEKFLKKDRELTEEQRRQAYDIAVKCVEEEEAKEDKEVKERREKKDEEEKKRKRERERTEEDLGIEIEGKFEKIEDVKTKDIYARLKEKRMKKDKDKTTMTNKALAEDYIFNELTTREKTYWFKIAHRAIQTNVRKNKWLKDKNGEQHTDRCPMCKTEVETWEHYDYDCEQVKTYMGKMGEVYEYYMGKMEKDMGIWTTPTKEEWRLDMIQMDKDKEMIIAKGRYVYDKMRSRTDYRQRKRSNVDMLIEELKERLELIIDRVKKKEEEERKENEKKETEDRENDAAQAAREREDRGISKEQQDAEDAAIDAWMDRNRPNA